MKNREGSGERFEILSLNLWNYHSKNKNKKNHLLLHNKKNMKKLDLHC